MLLHFSELKRALYYRVFAITWEAVIRVPPVLIPHGGGESQTTQIRRTTYVRTAGSGTHSSDIREQIEAAFSPFPSLFPVAVGCFSISSYTTHHGRVTKSPCFVLLLRCPLLTTPGYIFGSLPERCSAGQYGSMVGRRPSGVPTTDDWEPVPEETGWPPSASPTLFRASSLDACPFPFPTAGRSAGPSFPGLGERGVVEPIVLLVSSVAEIYLRSLHSACKVSIKTVPCR